MAKNRIKIESKDSDGNEKVVYATRPTDEENRQAQLISNKMFKAALLEGALVRKTLEDQLEKQGIWDKDKQEKLEAYNKEIVEHLTALKKGGIKLAEARDLAIKVRIARMESMNLQAERNEYDMYTAEAQAEGAKIDFLVATCIKDEMGAPVFKDLEEYHDNSEQSYVIDAAGKLVTLIYGMDDGWEADLPENKFLQKYKFVNDDLRLVNKDGQLVTIDGTKINKDFQYINDDGEVTDKDGNLIDDDGLPIVDVEPFLDDDGNPIVEEESAPDESVE